MVFSREKGDVGSSSPPPPERSSEIAKFRFLTDYPRSKQEKRSPKLASLGSYEPIVLDWCIRNSCVSLAVQCRTRTARVEHVRKLPL